MYNSVFGIVPPALNPPSTSLPPIGLTRIFRGVLPFIVADIVRITLIVAIPSISLFVPGLMEYRRLAHIQAGSTSDPVSTASVFSLGVAFFSALAAARAAFFSAFLRSRSWRSKR